MRLISELFIEEFIKKLPESLRRDRELDFLWDQIEENIENEKDLFYDETKNDLDIHKEICYGIRQSYNAINSKILEKIDDCELVLELLNLIEKYTGLDSVINVETWYALIDKDERFIEWADKTGTGYLALLVKYPDRFDEKRLIKIQEDNLYLFGGCNWILIALKQPQFLKYIIDEFIIDELLWSVKELYVNRSHPFEVTYNKLYSNFEAIKPKPLDAKGFLSREAIHSLDDFVNWVLENPKTPKEVIERIKKIY